MKIDRGRIGWLIVVSACALCAGSGCATMRYREPDRDLRPCTDGFAQTADGWHLGMRHYRPAQPDPGKYPVVLCHGLGLNGTFWTITDNHLPSQLTARGYEVFVCDLRGSGASYRDGRVGRINQFLRETPFLEIGDGAWTVDDESFYDVPAILDYVRRVTGSPRVNWVGHSLGGMLMYGFLELHPQKDQVANFVGMGATAALANPPDRDMLRANRGLRIVLSMISTGRAARPMQWLRPPGMDHIDTFYFTPSVVDRRTVSRFYGYALENPGRGALKQLDPYLEFGHMVSADRRVDYVSLLPTITTPSLLVAGEADVMSDIPSTLLTYNALGSPEKALLRFGQRQGHIKDYGHCDLVWSRYAPRELFPAIIDWLDNHQPTVYPSRQGPSPQSPPSAQVAPSQQRVDANLRPGLEPILQTGQVGDRYEARLR